MGYGLFFFFKQKTAYEIVMRLEFRRVLFRSHRQALAELLDVERDAVTELDGRAAGDRGHDPDLLLAFERRVETVAGAHVLAVHVHVHEASQLPGLVEDQIRDRKGAERRADGGRVELEPVLAPGLRRQQARKEDCYSHSPVSTDSTGGSWPAASIHSSPAFGETKIEPL